MNLSHCVYVLVDLTNLHMYPYKMKFSYIYPIKVKFMHITHRNYKICISNPQVKVIFLKKDIGVSSLHFLL